jgi:hypothetical protein
MKRTVFEIVLNNVVYELPENGAVVLKHVVVIKE